MWWEQGDGLVFNLPTSKEPNKANKDNEETIHQLYSIRSPQTSRFT